MGVISIKAFAILLMYVLLERYSVFKVCGLKDLARTIFAFAQPSKFPGSSKSVEDLMYWTVSRM